MPFVPVPKDLTKVKTKVAFNLTRRQLVCFGTAAAIGLPTYIFTRSSLGNDGAAFLMIGIMAPFFFFAMYEKDNQPAEKLLRNFIRARFFFPQKRLYKTNNLYALLDPGPYGTQFRGAKKEGQHPFEQKQKTGPTAKTARRKRQSSQSR